MRIAGYLKLPFSGLRMLLIKIPAAGNSRLGPQHLLTRSALAGSLERGARADFAFELDPLLARKRRDFTAVFVAQTCIRDLESGSVLNRASLPRVERPSF